MRPSIGIDFGTTNSVVAALRPDGSVATLDHAAGAVFRSVLCLWGGSRHAAGPAAIEAYLEDPLAARLIMSMKSYLAQRSFRETWSDHSSGGFFTEEQRNNTHMYYQKIKSEFRCEKLLMLSILDFLFFRSNGPLENIVFM